MPSTFYLGLFQMLNNEKINAIQNAVKKNFETVNNIINTLIGSFTHIEGHEFINEYLKFVSWHGKCFLIAVDHFNRINCEEDKIIFLRICESILNDSVILLKLKRSNQIGEKTLTDLPRSLRLHETFSQINHSINAITLSIKTMIDSIEEKPIGYKSIVFVEIKELKQNRLDSKGRMQYLIKINNLDWSTVLLMGKENNPTFDTIEPKIEDYTDRQLFEILDRINDELSKRHHIPWYQFNRP